MKLKDKILFELIRHVRKHGSEVLIPNIYFGRYEFDLFRLLNNGYLYEYEIKTSRADFKNDFKKAKKFRIDGGFIEISKHEEIQSGNYTANRFYFVVPEGLIKPNEVPKNVGLIYYYENVIKPFRIAKKAGFVNKNKIEVDAFELLKKMAYREFNLRQKLLND